MVTEYKKRGVSGFTLVEVAIVVLIAGLLLVPFLKGLEIWNERQAIKTTRENIKEVHLALSRYVAANNRLPCPGVASLPDSDPNFGASVDCNTAAAGPGLSIVPGEQPGTQVVIGAVPFRELSIPADVVSDAWGGRMTYAVTRNLATTPPPPGGFNQNAGAIRFINETGGDVIDPGRGLYALISHGRSGEGGYSKAGGVLRGACPSGTPESENCDFANAVFRTMNITEASGASYFDDYAAVQRNLVVPGDIDSALPNCTAGQYLTTVAGEATCVALPVPPPPPPICSPGQYLTNSGSGMVCTSQSLSCRIVQAHTDYSIHPGTSYSLMGSAAMCEPGEVATGGGIATEVSGGWVCESDNNVVATLSRPIGSPSAPNGWLTDGFGYDWGSDGCVYAFAICCKIE
jgi:type II secretory pathway pseudopilin PulG